MDDDKLDELVAKARSGDRIALEGVVRAVQDDVFDLSLRMLGHVDDARDASQEILVRLVTKLDSFRGESRFRTAGWQIQVIVAGATSSSLPRSTRGLSIRTAWPSAGFRIGKPTGCTWMSNASALPPKYIGACQSTLRRVTSRPRFARRWRAVI